MAEITERRQVFELPAPRLEVIEYQRLKRVCRCGQAVCGKFPEEVTGPVQYGQRVRTLVTLLSVHGCLSYAKIGQLFGDIYGLELNTATAQQMVHKSAEQMPLEVIKAGVLASPVVSFDETGITQDGQLKWLHTASTEVLTYQFVHARRGATAMSDPQSVLPQFKGIGVHDCWASYFRFGEMRHAICNAHVLRELTGIIENNQSRWGRQMKRLLLDLYVKSDGGKGVIQKISRYENRYRKILDEAEREEPPPERVNRKGKLKRTKGRNLLERLRKYEQAVLLFAKEQAVPFTNNQAERDIRPAKVKQKVTGGFRAASGSRSYSRIQSFISTLRKQKRQVFEELLSVIAGNPFELFQS